MIASSLAEEFAETGHARNVFYMKSTNVSLQRNDAPSVVLYATCHTGMGSHTRPDT